MSTQEERIAALERITREYRPVLQNLTYELTLVKTHVLTQTDLIQELKEDLTISFKQLADYHVKTEQQVDTRFNQVDTHFHEVDTRLVRLETTLSEHTTLLTQILERLPKAP